MKIVINDCYGGFSLSEEAYEELGVEGDSYALRCTGRNDADLVRVVEKLGEAANGACANLKVIEIPDDVEWHIEEYDGIEWVAENHRTWC